MSTTNLKSYCKAFKVKQPKEPFFPMSGNLMVIRKDVLKALHNYIDKGGDSIIVTLPMYSSLDWARDFRDSRLYLENGQYYFSSEKYGKHNLNDLSSDFLGEQIFYPLHEASPSLFGSSWSSVYERQFDDLKSRQEEWMRVIIANKDKRVTLQKGVSLQYSGYCPGEMISGVPARPGTIIAVYEKDGEHSVCVEGQDDIFWDELNIDTKVALCDELYSEFLPQVTPRTIEEALTTIALECKSSFPKETLAVEANTPVNVLSLLSDDKNEGVRVHVAMNKNAPIEILSKLAKDSSSTVRCAVAENANATGQMLYELIHDRKSESVQYAAAANPNLPTSILVELTTCPDIEGRSIIAANPSTPVESLVKLATDPEARVRAGVAKNPRTPGNILEQLAKYSDDLTAAYLIENPNTPLGALASCFSTLADSSPFNRERVAGDLRAPAEILARLAEDEDKDVREKVAKNPNTPKDRLAELAKDTSARVSRAASDHLATPEVYDSGCSCYNGKGSNEPEAVIPVEQLAQMALDKNDIVREQAAKNPNTPADSLTVLANDYMWNVVKASLLNPNTPLKALLDVANKEEKFMAVVVKNPSMPLQTLLELAAISCYYPKFYPTSAIIRALLDRI